jgi:uncharacterized protein
MTRSPASLPAAQARAIALTAQGFGRPARDLLEVAAGLGAVQIDAVNVLVRSHYLPFYSRLGGYDRDLFDDLCYRRHALFEYVGHAASLLPVELHPALRWRMAGYADHKNWAGFRARVEGERPGYLAAVEREITERGPLAYTELADTGRRDKQSAAMKYAESSLLWYRWSDGKSALEWLHLTGRLAIAGRRGFEPRYDLTERVIAPEVLAVPTPPEADAQRALVLTAMRALGVAVVRDVADYFRMPVAVTRARLRELLDAGGIERVTVEGWPGEAYLDPAAVAGPPAAVDAVAARALLSPFDSLLWERDRTRRLFGFEHVFELYVKPEKRRYGYYVLPFLLGDRLVARVDLKADRAARTLLVQGAWLEPGADRALVAEALSAELRTLADWLGLESIAVRDRGDLAASLT